MCKFGHSGPCYRDNLFEGPLPAAIWDDSKRMASITSDRVANAVRLNEMNKSLKPPPPVGDVVPVNVVCFDCDQFSDDAYDSAYLTVGFREPSLRLIEDGRKVLEARLESDPVTKGLRVATLSPVIRPSAM